MKIDNNLNPRNTTDMRTQQIVADAEVARIIYYLAIAYIKLVSTFNIPAYEIFYILATCPVLHLGTRM